MYMASNACFQLCACTYWWDTDLHVVLGFVTTLYEASKTDKATTIQIGLLNGILREGLSLELTSSRLIVGLMITHMQLQI
jgi:hypothetical protein